VLEGGRLGQEGPRRRGEEALVNAVGGPAVKRSAGYGRGPDIVTCVDPKWDSRAGSPRVAVRETMPLQREVGRDKSREGVLVKRGGSNIRKKTKVVWWAMESFNPRVETFRIADEERKAPV